MKQTRLFFIILLIIAVFACDDEPFDPIVNGSIKGVVLSDEDQSPIAGALVSTAPVSNSVITSDSGTFVMESIAVGEYDLVVEKTDYYTGRESIIIVEDDTTEITVLLREKTEINYSPDPPYSEYPLNFSENVGLQVVLSWKAEDVNLDDSLYYDVKLYSSADPEFITIASNTYVNNIELEDLLYGTTYFWQVIVYDGTNDPVNGPIWQFKTINFPDHRIFFTRQVNNIYQIFSGDENGNEIQLTYSQNHSWRPRIAPDRSNIAFISFDGIEKHLYLMKPDGTEIQKITNEVPIASFDEDFMDFCWSPNGANLMYTHYNKLYRINNDGSGLELITELEENLSFSSVDWTYNPNSQLLVRISAPNNYDGDIFLMSPNGTISDTLFENQPGRTTAGSFSIDGMNILYTHDNSGFQGSNGRQLDAHIEIKNVSTSAVIDLSTSSKPDGTNDLDPRYSPNGAYIIFVNTSNDGISIKNIYKMDLEGQRVLLFENAEMPDWR